MPAPPPPPTGRQPLPPGSAPTILACGLLIVLSGCDTAGTAPARTETRALPTIEAHLITLEPQPWPMLVRSQGNLVADEVAVIGSRVEGRVEQVHVNLGDPVTDRMPLVTLKQAEFQLHVEQCTAQLLQARSAVGLGADDPLEQLDPEHAPPVRETRAQWDQAQADSKRADMLQAQNTITAAEYEKIKTAEEVASAQYRSALNGVREKIALIGVRQAELELARENLADTVIRAPFDGSLQQRQVSPGTYVSVGDPMVTVVRTSLLRFRGMIPERHALAIDEGQEVSLKIESVAQPVQVRVTRISPSLDPLSRSLLFEAEVDNRNGRLRNGLFAEAQIVIDDMATSLVIPSSALIEFAGVEKVWKVVDGQAREQTVLTGQRRDEGIEIIDGLTFGDVILQEASHGRVANVKPLPSEVPATAADGAATHTGRRAPQVTAESGGSQ